MGNGVCKLTGVSGKFVKSHILPAALTRPEHQGAFLLQAGFGRSPVRRWSSWYDSKIVTRKGECILADYDDWGIRELRSQKLVWSSWGPMQELRTNDWVQIRQTDWGLRRIVLADPERFRLFFLSLLWRAAASSLDEFDEIRLSGEELSKLGDMLIRKSAEPFDFYPVSLTQISTVGAQHNHTPIAHIKAIPEVGDLAAHKVPIYRFYIDGLAIHFDRRSRLEGFSEAMGPLVVGPSSSLAVSTVTYESSFQRENFEITMAETYREWPQQMAKLNGDRAWPN